MQRKFGKEPFLIGHDLTHHPLFALPRLVELSKTLPANCVEYNSGDLPIGQDPNSIPSNGLSAQETVRQIEHCRSWMLLRDVEQDPLYKQLVDAALDQVRSAIDPVEPGMGTRKAFIIVSSPGAVAPFHADFEYNFLLHIRGVKFMTVFDGQDRSLFGELERERLVSGGTRYLDYRDEFAPKGKTFRLTPGVGLHVPLTSPHWVRVADNVCISFGITFHSNLSQRTIGAHLTNALLRKFGVSPRPVGESAGIDSIKYLAHRAVRRFATMTNRRGVQS